MIQVKLHGNSQNAAKFLQQLHVMNTRHEWQHLTNLVPSVSHLTAPWTDGKVRDPGNEVDT